MSHRSDLLPMISFIFWLIRILLNFANVSQFLKHIKLQRDFQPLAELNSSKFKKHWQLLIKITNFSNNSNFPTLIISFLISLLISNFLLPFIIHLSFYSADANSFTCFYIQYSFTSSFLFLTFLFSFSPFLCIHIFYTF